MTWKEPNSILPNNHDLMAIDRSTPPPFSELIGIKLDVPAPITISNGMKMWIAGDGEDEINRLSIYMTGGAFHETCIMQATSCSLAVFNGNKNMNYNEIAEAIDFYGAWRAAMVHDNCTSFSLSSLNENFDKTLPILIDCLRFPTFPDAEFELIKRQLSVNCATARERVKYLANVEMMKMYYGNNHPLAIDPKIEDIESLSQENVKLFHQEYYKAQNCNIVLAGHITDREIGIVENVLGEWKPNGEPTEIRRPAPEPTDEMLKVVHKEGAVQSAIAMTIVAVPRTHPDYFKIRILVTALGGYFGSRLMATIREEKGYTYGINASLSGRDFDGYVSISTECDTKFTWKVIDEVKNEILKLQKDPLPDDELKVVKRYMMSDLAKTLDTPYNIASYIGNMFCYGTYPTYFNKHIKEIMNVTSDDLHKIANIYLNLDKLRIVVACDKNKLQESA